MWSWLIKGKTGQLKGETGKLNGKTGQLKGETGKLNGKTGQLKGETGKLNGKTGKLKGKTGKLNGKTGKLKRERKHSEMACRELLSVNLIRMYVLEYSCSKEGLCSYPMFSG